MGTITIRPSCNLIEVYLVDGLKHNLMSISQVYLADELKHTLLSISQLRDVVFSVNFNAVKCTILNLSKNFTIIGDHVENIYILNNVDLPTLTCLTTIINDQWIWHRKLGHGNMHAIEKLSRLDLVIGLHKLNLKKDHPCDAFQFGK